MHVTSHDCMHCVDTHDIWVIAVCTAPHVHACGLCTPPIDAGPRRCFRSPVLPVRSTVPTRPSPPSCSAASSPSVRSPPAASSPSCPERRLTPAAADLPRLPATAGRAGSSQNELERPIMQPPYGLIYPRAAGRCCRALRLRTAPVRECPVTDGARAAGGAMVTYRGQSPPGDGRRRDRAVTRDPLKYIQSFRGELRCRPVSGTGQAY